MTTPKKSTLEKPLTEVELEIMNVIWELGECTVKDVQTKLPKGRDLAYTSVATMMKILEQKGVVVSRKEDRAHLFRPVISRPSYEATSLRHLTKSLFKGDPTSMVMRLLNDAELTDNELKIIKKTLDEKLKR